MKRDFDIIRTLLLKLEEDDQGEGSKIFVMYDPQKDEWHNPLRDEEGSAVYGHAKLLVEAGFVDGFQQSPSHGNGAIVLKRITWQGHEFLDSVRDEEIWRETKSRLGAVSGTAGTETIKLVVQSVSRTLLGM